MKMLKLPKSMWKSPTIYGNIFVQTTVHEPHQWLRKKVTDFEANAILQKQTILLRS